MQYRIWWVGVAALAMLAGCGGGGESGGDAAQVAASLARKSSSFGMAPGASAAYALKAAAPVTGDVVANGGFESGTASWTVSSSANASLIGSFSEFAANTGRQYAWLGGIDEVTDRLSQAVTVPAGGTGATLQFWYHIASSDSQFTAYDTLSVDLYSTSGTRLAALGTFSNVDRTTGWTQSQPYDLTAFQGQSVQLRFTATNDISESTSFLIDDVSLAPASGSAVVPVNGVWWNPAESGRGFILERQGASLFLGSYLYEEATGASTWYSALLSQQASGAWTGSFTRFSGGQTLTGAYRAPTGTTEVAQLSLVFDSPTIGTLVVQPAGGGAPKVIVLQQLRLGNATSSSSSCQSGVWWNSAESGRGYVLEVQGTTAMLASFMFTDAGQPVWYLTTAQLSSASSFSGALQQFGGGQSLTGSYRNPAALSASPGTVQFTCNSGTTATLTLPGGRSIGLQRFIFGNDPGTGSGGGGSGSGGGTGPGTTPTPPVVTPPTGTSYRLTTGTTGGGRGTVTPASGTTYPANTVVTVNPQPHYFSEFVDWTTSSSACAGATLACDVTMSKDQYLQARMVPAVFSTSFDANYTTYLANGCDWAISWTNTSLKVSIVYNADNTFVARMRATGRRVATVTRSYPGTTCNGSTTNASVSVDVPISADGFTGQVRVFDGSGDEYLTVSTGEFHVPGPRIGAVYQFTPVSVRLQYTGTNRTGSTSMVSVLQRGIQ